MKKISIALFIIMAVLASSFSVFADEVPEGFPPSTGRSAAPFAAPRVAEGTLPQTEIAPGNDTAAGDTRIYSMQDYQEMNDAAGQIRPDTSTASDYSDEMPGRDSELIVLEPVERYNHNSAPERSRRIIVRQNSVVATDGIAAVNDIATVNIDEVIVPLAINSAVTNNIQPYTGEANNPMTGAPGMSVALLAGFAAVGAAPLVYFRKK